MKPLYRTLVTAIFAASRKLSRFSDSYRSSSDTSLSMGMNKMKHLNTSIIALLAVLTTSGAAQASLIDKGSGLIYDIDLNITWLANANINGAMTWSQANAWAASLNVAGVSGWRLPTVTDTGVPGCGIATAYSGGDCGYNVDTATGEMAHLFYDELGNKALFDTSGTRQAGAGPVNTSPFTNLESYYYWYGTESALSNVDAWTFRTTHGYQGTANKENDLFYALAVHSGEVTTVPVPATLWFLGSGLFGLIGVARRKRK